MVPSGRGRDDPVLERQQSESIETSPISDALHFRLEALEQARTGERVPITLRLQNTSNKAVDVYLTGRPIAFDLVVAREGGEVVWRRLEGETVPMVLQIRQLATDEILKFQEIWDQRTNRGEPVGPGLYTLQGFLLTDSPDPLTTAPVPLRIVPT
jgi:hypothetical protein